MPANVFASSDQEFLQCSALLWPAEPRLTQRRILLVTAARDEQSQGGQHLLRSLNLDVSVLDAGAPVHKRSTFPSTTPV